MTAPARRSSKSAASAAGAQARDEVRVPSFTAPFGAGITAQVIFERCRHALAGALNTNELP